MSKNKTIRDDFNKFCDEHPELRFWQALNAFTNRNIYLSKDAPTEDNKELIDPFYFNNLID